MSLSQQATELYARRDQIAAELAQIDVQLNRLRTQYMVETSTYGINPTNFRRAVEKVSA